MAVHTKWCDAIATIFTAEKFCENFINEDNFNNTFLIKKSLQTTFVEWIDANIIKRCDILSIKRFFYAQTKGATLFRESHQVYEKSVRLLHRLLDSNCNRYSSTYHWVVVHYKTVFSPK